MERRLKVARECPLPECTMDYPMQARPLPITGKFQKCEWFRNLRERYKCPFIVENHYAQIVQEQEGFWSAIVTKLLTADFL